MINAKESYKRLIEMRRQTPEDIKILQLLSEDIREEVETLKEI